MNCTNCGKTNTSNAKFCTRCGELLETPEKKKKQKNKETIIVTFILLSALILATIAGVFIYKFFDNRNANFLSVGGGGNNTHDAPIKLPPVELPPVELPPAEVPPVELPPVELPPAELPPVEVPPVEVPPVEVPPVEVPPVKFPPAEVPPANVPEPPSEKDRSEKRNEFLDKALVIEQYYDEHLKPTNAQTEINIISGEVYDMWDDLLNEVYQYLATILPHEEFEALVAEEISWVLQKEQAIEKAAAEWEGGSGEIMIRNTTAIGLTKERCYYLIALID